VGASLAKSPNELASPSRRPVFTDSQPKALHGAPLAGDQGGTQFIPQSNHSASVLIDQFAGLGEVEILPAAMLALEQPGSYFLL
jgi:hypothetical protein